MILWCFWSNFIISAGLFNQSCFTFNADLAHNCIYGKINCFLFPHKLKKSAESYVLDQMCSILPVLTISTLDCRWSLMNVSSGVIGIFTCYVMSLKGIMVATCLNVVTGKTSQPSALVTKYSAVKFIITNLLLDFVLPVVSYYNQSIFLSQR